MNENENIFNETPVEQVNPQQQAMNNLGSVPPVQPQPEPPRPPMPPKKSKGPVIIIILLLLIIFGLAGYIYYDKFMAPTEPKETKDTDTTKKNDNVDEKQVLKEVTKVYEEAYNGFLKDFSNDAAKDVEFYKNKYGKLFTDDGAYRVFEMMMDTTGSGILKSIFNETDQGIRTLKLVYTDGNIAVATGTYTVPEDVDWGSSSPYPEYIIFKKINNTWKIDMFE